QANSGASRASSWASKAKAEAAGAGGGRAEKRGRSSSRPRKSWGLSTSPQAIRPLPSSNGSPSAQRNWRASSRVASSTSVSGCVRSKSARQIPGPAKNGSGGKRGGSAKHRFGGASVEGRESGFVQAIDRLPPAI